MKLKESVTFEVIDIILKSKALNFSNAYYQTIFCYKFYMFYQTLNIRILLYYSIFFSFFIVFILQLI
jgi:hypothetical protein